MSARTETIVLHAGRQYLGSEKAAVKGALGRRRGVLAVEANPVAQAARVTYDPAATSVEEVRASVERQSLTVAINEAWDENYGLNGVPNGPNIPFHVPRANLNLPDPRNANLRRAHIDLSIGSN